MNVTFAWILFIATIVTGVIVLLDSRLWAKKRVHGAKLPLIIDYSRSFFPVLLIVFILRSFIVEPFRIPSGSLEPTLQIGDFIAVNKFAYGVRLPILHTKIIKVGEPKRGDIAVFRWPANPKIDYIKRIIGVPGDRISYINKVLYINGKQVPQTLLGHAVETSAGAEVWPVLKKREALPGKVHDIYIKSSVPSYDFKDLTVPQGYYFAMGDNRDDSADSRFWGFVPEANFVGKAFIIWMSWDSERTDVRWHRIGELIK